MSRKYLKLYSLFCLIVFLPSICLAQATVNTQWRTIESPKKDLSFDVPENFLVNKGNGEQEFFAFHNNAIMNVTINDDGSPKNILKSYRTTPNDSEAKISQFTMGDFTGDVYRTEKGKKLSFVIYMASSEAFYSILISSRDSSNPSFGKFVRSIKLRDKPLFEQPNTTDEANLPKISIENLKTSPIISEVLEAKETKRQENSKRYETKYGKDDDKEIEDKKNYSRPIIVLRRPQPRYTDTARQARIGGKVKLQVKLQADGMIGDVIILSRLDNGLEKNAVEAVRKLKFLPAEIDGKPVDVIKKITYTFTIY